MTRKTVSVFAKEHADKLHVDPETNELLWDGRPIAIAQRIRFGFVSSFFGLAISISTLVYLFCEINRDFCFLPSISCSVASSTLATNARAIENSDRAATASDLAEPKSDDPTRSPVPVPTDDLRPR